MNKMNLELAFLDTILNYIKNYNHLLMKLAAVIDKT